MTGDQTEVGFDHGLHFATNVRLQPLTLNQDADELKLAICVRSLQLAKNEMEECVENLIQPADLTYAVPVTNVSNSAPATCASYGAERQQYLSRQHHWQPNVFAPPHEGDQDYYGVQESHPCRVELPPLVGFGHDAQHLDFCHAGEVMDHEDVVQATGFADALQAMGSVHVEQERGFADVLQVMGCAHVVWEMDCVDAVLVICCADVVQATGYGRTLLMMGSLHASWTVI